MLITGVALLPLLSSAVTYYVDSSSDYSAIQNQALNAGDQILFKRGMVFNGPLKPTGQGAPGNPIIIGAYGSGDRPVINGNGTKATVWLYNPHYLEISGLEVTNTDGTTGDQGDNFGILAHFKGVESVYEHVYIIDNYVHDVNGNVAGKARGGIHARMENLDNSIVNDLHIINNIIEDVGGVGIATNSDYGDVTITSSGYVAENLWSNVLIKGNRLDRIGRNCIIVRDSINPIVEYNVVANGSRYDTGNSIFCFDTVGCIMQYNEAYGNTGSGADRGGFDADYSCVDTYIQYNYSHDNEWFCSIMKKPLRNVTIRYNISQNQKQGFYFYGFNSNAECENVQIYNNTHYVSAGNNAAVFVQGRTPVDTTFENNIFYFEDADDSSYGTGNLSDVVFNNNLYYNLTPHQTDANAIVADPRFLNPGSAGTDIDLNSMGELAGYQLISGSSAINAGVPISNNGGEDIVGNAVNQNWTDLGAYEGKYTGALVQMRKRNAMSYCINGGSGGSNGQNVSLYTYIDGHYNLTWEEIDRGNGYYSYQKKGTTVSLDGGNGGANHQNVYLGTTSSSNYNQQWKKVDKGNGYYQLQKRNALDVCLNGGSGGADTQNVTLYNSSNGSYNLQWFVEYK